MHCPEHKLTGTASPFIIITEVITYAGPKIFVFSLLLSIIHYSIQSWVCAMLKYIWKAKQLRLKTKLRLFNSHVVSHLLYCSDCGN